MEKEYEEILASLSQRSHLAKPKLYCICHKLGYLAKVDAPSLHWEVTDSGRQLLVVSNLEEICERVEDAAVDLADGPNLGEKPVHPTKVCGRCGKSKEYDHFGNSEKTDDGLTKWCSSCW